MINKKVDMILGSDIISINIDGFSDDAIDTIKCFIDNMECEFTKLNKPFQARIVNAQTWNNYDIRNDDEEFSIDDIVSRVNRYLHYNAMDANSMFVINDGTNMEFDIFAKLYSSERPSKHAFDFIGPVNITFNHYTMIYTIEFKRNIDPGSILNYVKFAYPAKENVQEEK